MIFKNTKLFPVFPLMIYKKPRSFTDKLWDLRYQSQKKD